MKMIIMSVSVEYSCYCVFKPENKHTYLRNYLICIMCDISDFKLST